jgi:hypothetical protein
VLPLLHLVVVVLPPPFFCANADAGAGAAFNPTGAGASPPSPLPPRASRQI